MKADEAPAPLLRCTHCRRPLESCAFCDEEHCAVGVCYICLRTALGEASSQPHAHGG